MEITFGNRWRGILAALVANAFPLSRDSAIRASLQHMDWLMDEGWSVVLFPEGEQRLGQPLQPFQSGTGMLSGAPLTFPPCTSYIEATEAIEAAVKAL